MARICFFRSAKAISNGRKYRMMANRMDRISNAVLMVARELKKLIIGMVGTPCGVIIERSMKVVKGMAFEGKRVGES